MPAREFVLKHEFKDVANLIDGKYYLSEWEEHFNVKWRVHISKGEHLEFGIWTGLQEGSGQSVQAHYKLHIISPLGEVMAREATNGKNFTEKMVAWRFEKFTEWKNVVDKYLIDGNLKVEAHVKVLKVTGIPREHLRSFGDDVRQFSDVALVVNDEKFYVSKLFLSNHSPFFATLFLGPFDESGKSEVHLKDVDPINLQYFLEILYGEPGVDDDTVDGILAIADMYDTPIVVRKCEEFLLEKSEMELKEKLQLAGKYKLEKLRESCMEKIETVADIRSVAPLNARDMDHEILAELFEKVMAFH